MIVVSDNRGDRVEVGEARWELERYLDETCDEDYAKKVLIWFDTDVTSTLEMENGIEGVTDTWEFIDDQAMYYEMNAAAEEDDSWNEEEEESDGAAE